MRSELVRVTPMAVSTASEPTKAASSAAVATEVFAPFNLGFKLEVTPFEVDKICFVASGYLLWQVKQILLGPVRQSESTRLAHSLQVE